MHKIEIGDACVEVKIRGKGGKNAKIYLDPATGAIATKGD